MKNIFICIKFLSVFTVIFLYSCKKNPEGDSEVIVPDGFSVREAGENARNGRIAFAQCAVCHSFKKDAPHRIGPNLYGIFGKPAGNSLNYTYSTAMKNSGIVWSEEALGAFIENPGKYIPGTRMAYQGEKNGQVRNNIIDYLKNIENSGHSPSL